MAVFTYSNNSGLTIADASVVFQQVYTYGQVGNVTDVSISLNDLTHTFPDDLDMLLIGPNGASNLLFMSDAGAGDDIGNVDLTFSDAAGGGLPDASQIGAGTYLPTDYNVVETDVTFGTATSGINSGSATTFATAFGGSAGNGFWSLYVNDDLADDTGSLAGWSVSVTTASNQASLIGTGSDDQFTLSSSIAGTGLFGVNVADPVGYSGVNSWLIDGGGGVDILYFFSDGANTYSFDLTTSDLTSIETLSLFDPGAGGTATVTLNASEIGDGFAANGTVGGALDSSVADTLAIVMGADTAVDLSLMTFLNFFQPLDRVTITGDGDGETITGSAMRDVIDAGDGGDTINGGGGNDTIIAGASSLGDGVDTVNGGAGNDDITGGYFVDILNGDAGNDTFFFSEYDFFDSVDGGADSDTLNFSGSALSGITVNLDAGTYSNQSQIDVLTFTSIERVIGSAQGDTITASGVVSVDASFGDDTVIVTDAVSEGFYFGGVGNDTLDMSSDFFEGYNYDLSASSFDISGAVFSGFENVIDNDGINQVIGSAAANVLRGNGGGDLLYGNGGDDTIEGGTGGDVLDGGSNDANGDTLSYAASAAGVTVNLATNVVYGGDAQNDTVSYFENVGGSNQNDVITGTGLDNRLYGNGGRDALYGGAGGDSLYGGDEVGAGDNLYGGGDNDALYGGGGNDNLYGDGGSDELSGEDGNDYLYIDGLDILVDGGAGYDWAIGLTSATGITLNLGTALIEGVQGSNSQTDTLDASTSLVAVNIWGLGGADFLTGSGFNDYVYFDQLDLATGSVNAGAGFDWLLNRGTTAVTFDMAARGAEGYYGSALADTVTAAGSAVGVSIYGNGGGDVITGSGFGDYIYFEADTVSINGGAGYDYAIYNPVSVVAGVTLNLTTSAIEYAIGRSGADTFTAAGASWLMEIHAGGGTDTLTAGNAGSYLFGEAGIDTLISGNGSDQMLGGADFDTFRFADGGGTDYVWDWQDGTDRIDLSLVTGIDDFTDLTINSAYAASNWYGYGYGSGTVWVQTGGAGALDATDFFY